MLRDKKIPIILLFLLIFITACATTHKQSGVYHRVKKGETLWRISRAYNCDLAKLAEANSLPDTNIKAGSVLFIPNATNAKSIKSGKTRDTKKTFRSRNIQKQSDKKSLTKKPSSPKNVPKTKPGKPSLIWPGEGKVTSKFGTYKGLRHNGIKISGKEGASIVASAGGIVIHSAPIKYYGETIIIKHNSTYSTVYSNLKARSVQTGHVVSKGDKIALLGKEAQSGKSYLYFEIRYKNRARNPIFYLPKKK